MTADAVGIVAGVTQGIVKRHRPGCPGGRCRCSSFQAWVYDAQAGRKIRKTFDSEQAAKNWRADTISKVSSGSLRAGSGVTVRRSGRPARRRDEGGTVRNRSGRSYKPSVAESYSSSLEQHVYPWMGARRLSAVDRRMVQRLVDDLTAGNVDPKTGLRVPRSASTVRNVLMPLRVIFRRALRDGEVAVNPVVGVELPAADEKARDRFATPAESQRLVEALPAPDRAAWALAFYAGLRLGELRAVEWGIRRPGCRRVARAPRTTATALAR